VKFVRSLLTVFLVCPIGTASAIDTTSALESPEQQALYEKLTAEVRCLVCQNQTIADSSAPLALDLRREIRERVGQGQSESEIKVFLTERYGDFVLYRPRYGGVSSVLWIAPGVLLLIGIVVLWNVVRRRSEFPITTEEQDAIDPVTDADADLRQD
jgi:cytochrome c-type biogenesis protein CcmH